MMNSGDLKIAWLLPTAGLYWQPLLSEFTRLFPQTIVFVGAFPGFIQGFEDSFMVEDLQGMRIVGNDWQSKTYKSAFTYFSPKIISHLLRFTPNVIFSNAFSIWTLLAVLLKPVTNWRVVLICDGSSPGVDYLESHLRLFQRRMMARFIDAFITNTNSGKSYLTKYVGAKDNTVFAKPYLVPDVKALSQNIEGSKQEVSKIQHPIFLYIGSLIPRKGLHKLLQACSILQAREIQKYTLMIVGRGVQHQELERFVKNHNLENRVRFVGKIDYGSLGDYLQKSDVFVFPTLEDVWGLAPVEAMAFGKPILCSKWAGAAEMVEDGKNGYIFDPYQPETLAELMSKFIDNPDLIAQMGAKSQKIMANHTPEVVATTLAEVVEFVLTE